ncbi:MAG: twitching motility protein PilT [Ignavibacteria bacterium]
MPTLRVRCYAELNDCLPVAQRQRWIERYLNQDSTVDELVRSLGIQPTQVDLVLVNGDSVEWNHVLHDKDCVSLYPVFESFDIGGLTRLRSKPLREPRFVLDVHLGTLAHLLRMLGFDAVNAHHSSDEELVRLSTNDGRTLLSKDRALLRHDALTRRYRVQSSNPREQLLEVLRRFDLFHSFSPFTRCIECNHLLRPVAKADVVHRLPAKVRELYNEFQLCTQCERVYWQGPRYAKMREFIFAIQREGEHRSAGGV